MIHRDNKVAKSEYSTTRGDKTHDENERSRCCVPGRLATVTKHYQSWKQQDLILRLLVFHGRESEFGKGPDSFQGLGVENQVAVLIKT